MMVRAWRPISDADYTVPEVATHAITTAQHDGGPHRDVLEPAAALSTIYVFVAAPSNQGITSLTAHSNMADLSRRSAQRTWYRRMKRSIDVTVAAAGLVITAPVLGVLGLLIRLDSPGPVFFRQTRVGEGGRLFTIIKLRTMREATADESAVDQIGPDVDRVTVIGRHLRRWSLDELPQLLNVLRGEQIRSFMYVDDCVEGLQRVMRSDHAQPINLGTERSVTINELVDIVTSIAGKHLHIRHNLTGPQGVRGRNSDNRRLRETVGWEPATPLETGLTHTYTWVRDQTEIERRADAIHVATTG